MQSVAVEAEGVGGTPAIAVLRALDQAIAQVNGRRVSSSTQSEETGLRLSSDDLGTTRVDADAYINRVVSASDGAVRSFSVLSQTEIERTDYERELSGAFRSGGWFGDRLDLKESERRATRYWKVRVRADVAKFVGPDDSRPRLVIAAPRVSSASFVVGDERVDAGAIANEVRARLSDALSQTERFNLLDREFNDELQSEIDLINSGNARVDEVARIGQRLAADLILVPTIEGFAYPKRSRKLHMSDRELVSYSGGGRISLRLISATTGEVVLSESFSHDLPPTGPSTLARTIDGVDMANSMMDALSSQMVQAMINEIFPVSVVALSGNQVVLSQGGKSLMPGQQYQAVILGEPLHDPQTGRSLGRMEIPCCIITIDRVSDKTSYGTIAGDVPRQLAAFKPGMVELRNLTSRSDIWEKSTQRVDRVDHHPPRASGRSSAAAARRAQSQPAAAETEDEDW
ncbi:MAG TPA: CsgG/HfaB family protein [Lysobacter sp.]|nr:CsgG/HfaB family protein [Lysobacter sp.]